MAPGVVALVLAGFYAPLWLGQQLYRRDTWRMMVPCRAYVGERLRAGEFPSWFPYESLGSPFHAQAVCGVLHPLTWLSVLLRPELVITVQSLCAVALAAWGTWRLARLLGATRGGSAAAAVAYALGGYLTSETANIVYLWGAAVLPVQLYAFGRVALRGWDRAHLLLALGASASTLLIGDLQGAYLFTLAAGCFGLALAEGRWRPYLAGSAVCAVLLAGVCAAQLLPSWKLLQSSARAGGVSWEDATYWSLHPLRLPELLLPGLSPLGAPGRAQALFGSVPGYLLWAEALGGSALVSCLAVFGLLHPGVSRRVRGVLGGLALVGLLLALGRYGGLYRLAYAVLPLLDSFRWPEKLVPFFLVPWAVLAALGWSRALEGRWRPTAFAAGGLGLLAVGALGAAGAFSAEAGGYLGDLGLSLAFGAGVLALCALLTRVNAGLRGPVLFALVLLETTSSSLPALDVRPLEDSASPPVTVEPLRAMGVGLGQKRVMNLGLGTLQLDESGFATEAERRRVDLDRDALIALMGGPYGIEVPDLYFQGHPPRLPEILDAGLAWVQALAPRLNVGAALTLESYGPDLVKLGFQPRGRTSTGVFLFEVPQVWPRAWLGAPRALEPGRAPVEQLATLERGTVLVPGWAEPPGPPATGSARVTAYAPEEVRVAVQAEAPGVLVLNDLHSPGWSATVGGEPAPILGVNLVVRGVRVPAGTHEVVFRYEAPGLTAGMTLSALSLVLLTLLLLWRWPWHRIRPMS
ncbi:MAG TPA: YfhO family protein [Archangium sp.]|uniref:YfhO family protein n=1 Tax=Archangium sp. TaxID=1872627 RepID=UPI002E324E76|nr:YfhO family protein [Archangium sp.]HEX5746865.1 YfhO family protein [Archangium sp.]